MAAALILATDAAAETFTIEKNDPRPFRIHNGPDETPVVPVRRQGWRLSQLEGRCHVVGWHLAESAEVYDIMGA